MLVSKKNIQSAIESAKQEALAFIQKHADEKAFMCADDMRAVVVVSQESARKFFVGFRFDEKINEVGFNGEYCGKSYEIVWVS